MKNKVKRSTTSGSPTLESTELIVRLDKLSKRLRFEDVQVIDAAIEQPSLYLASCRLRVKVMEHNAIVMAEYEQYRSSLYSELRGKMLLKSPGRVTNVEVESALSQDPRIQKMVDKKNACDRLEELSKGMVEAFRQRLSSIRVVADVIISEGRVERSVLANDKMGEVQRKLKK